MATNKRGKQADTGGGPITVVGDKRASPAPAEVLQALDRIARRTS